MEHDWSETLKRFLIQSYDEDLKTASYPKEYLELTVRVSFGMGVPARVPWIGLPGEGMTISHGIYPVYLYYKDLGTLILAYGISETEESTKSWPAEIFSSSRTIEAYFDQKIPRYGTSFVFKAYKVDPGDGSPVISDVENGEIVSSIDLNTHLKIIVEYYKTKVLSLPLSDQFAGPHGGLFYMEKQLEDFLIHNWTSSELGKKYDLIIEEGELLSQQYKTDIGSIDILAKEKNTGGYVVIELKRDQTSDDTVGQVARYMGWVRRHMKTENVKGVIIAGNYDKKLEYALDAIQKVEVFIYEVNFRLKKFQSQL